MDLTLRIDEAAAFALIERDMTSLLREKLRHKRCIVYGAGWIGRWILQQLEQMKLDIFCFLDDHYEGEFLGKPVFFPDSKSLSDDEKKNSIVIISFMTKSPVHQNRVIEKLVSNGFVAEQVDTMDMLCYRKYDKTLIAQNLAAIQSAAALFRDQESIAVFMGWIEAIAYSDYRKFAIPTKELQYFPTDISFAGGYRSFVDAGGYTGDTYEHLVALPGEKSSYMAFEPDMQNFDILCATVAKTPVIEHTFLYPCGLLDHNSTVHFQHVSGGGSAVTNGGSEQILCVSLDKIVPRFVPTMIKMDIEGSELMAIMGARNIIKRHTPDLAICVYHKPQDVWEIPLLLHSICPKYRFYLKAHCMYGMETVLYATV